MGGMEDHGMCSVLFPTRNGGARFEIWLIITELRSLKHYWEACLFGEGAYVCVGHLQGVLAASFPDLITKVGENISRCFGVEVQGTGPACLRSRHENCFNK